MTALRDVGYVLGDFLVSAAGWLTVTSLAYQTFSWHHAIVGSIGFGVASAVFVAWQRFRARKEPQPVRWTAAMRRGQLPVDLETWPDLRGHVAAERRRAKPLWLTALVFVGIAAGALGWAIVAGSTHRLVAATVLAAVLCLVVIREYVWLRQLARMERLLETVTPTREEVSW